MRESGIGILKTMTVASTLLHVQATRDKEEIFGHFWRKWEKKIAKSLLSKNLTINFELNLVPRAGVEPARVAPLVFETSASTDSAIWA